MLGGALCGARQLRGRISVVPGGHDSPGRIAVPRPPGARPAVAEGGVGCCATAEDVSTASAARRRVVARMAGREGGVSSGAIGRPNDTMPTLLRRPAPAGAPASTSFTGEVTGDGPTPIHDVFVARQPIFDGNDRLFAYELLYRSGTQHNWANGVSADQMCTDTVLHTLMTIGLAPLTNNTIAFVNMTRDFLVRNLYELFDPKTVVIELLETVEPDDEVVAACKTLVAAGYTLALDDFVNAPGYEALLQLASIVKLDVLDRDAADIKRAVDELRPYNVRLLAERVETAEVRDTCKRLGFTLFQGYFYSKPIIVSHRELSTEQTTMLRLMGLLDDPRATDADIENAFRTDPSMSYKLLRIANSASFGGRDVQSIGYALRLVGRKALHRWLSLLLVSTSGTNNGIAGELVMTALARARMCELVAERGGRPAHMGALFLTGLFSLLDVLLKMPMSGILERMAIAPEVRDALLTRSGPHAPILALVEAQERGDWDAATDACSAIGIAPRDAAETYRAAIVWAGVSMSW